MNKNGEKMTVFVDTLQNLLRGIKNGSVTVIKQDGGVIQINVTERSRTGEKAVRE